MKNRPDGHPISQLELADSVERNENESLRHWAIKAAIVARLQSNPDYEGVIESEKKVEDQIGDLRCNFSRSPNGVPSKCVFEVQTQFSKKNYVSTTRRYLRFGYAVFWVFTAGAFNKRREAEKQLSEHVSETPSFGIASLDEGELQLGQPIVQEVFDFESTPEIPHTEFYIPTYDRYNQCFDHGDFEIEGRKVGIVSVAGQNDFFYSEVADEGGQRTLPQCAIWDEEELYQGLQENSIKRLSPVRGPP